MASKSVVLNVRLPAELNEALELARGSETRSGWVVRHLEGLLSGEAEELREPARVVELRPGPALSHEVERVEGPGVPPPAIAPRRPVEVRASLAAVRDRPAKPARLEVARRVKSSAEAKAGLKPVDWRGPADDAA